MSDSTLHTVISALIDLHGLAAVYRDVRDRDGFCNNCGTPLVEGQLHRAQGLGMCMVVGEQHVRGNALLE